MLLTPDHFLRQERYIDALNLWATRYISSAFGLIGGGPRLSESERGAVRHDPVITLAEDSAMLAITITQVRGLTVSGQLIEVDPTVPLRASIPKTELAGITDTCVYVTTGLAEKDILDGVTDEFNPQMKTERYPAYRISLRPRADQADSSLAVARLCRPSVGTGYEKDSKYIPPCTSLVSFSELTAGWRKIVERVGALSQRYTELHRAMREFLLLFTERGIETEGDREAATFVERMVVALQSLVYEVLDPIQSPQQLFGYLRRFFHGSATFLDLCPGVRQYYETLKETGETEFIALVEQQRRLLELTRTWQLDANLAAELRTALDSLQTLNRLERALEGKYVDFHVSQTLEAMNFVFDRGGRILFKMVAKPARLQGVGEDLTIHFSQLRLEGRDRYRLILVGEQNASFEKGYKIPIEIRINEGSGFRREPVILTSEAKLDEQYNFDFDFEVPDVPTILDLRITLQAHHPIRTALLYSRHRFYSNDVHSSSAARPVELGAERIESAVDRTRYREEHSSTAAVMVPEGQSVGRNPQRPLAGPMEPMPPQYRGDRRIQSTVPGDVPAWDNKTQEEKPRSADEPPVRRRRLD